MLTVSLGEIVAIVGIIFVLLAVLAKYESKQAVNTKSVTGMEAQLAACKLNCTATCVAQNQCIAAIKKEVYKLENSELNLSDELDRGRKRFEKIEESMALMSSKLITLATEVKENRKVVSEKLDKITAAIEKNSG